MEKLDDCDHDLPDNDDDVDIWHVLDILQTSAKTMMMTMMLIIVMIMVVILMRTMQDEY